MHVAADVQTFDRGIPSYKLRIGTETAGKHLREVLMQK